MVETIDNQKYWNARYRSGNPKGSGKGSRGREAEIKREAVSSLLANGGIRSVLDIGCGDCEILEGVDLDGIEYVGTDISDAIVRRNARRWPDRTFHYTNFNRAVATLGDRTFDLVMCVDVLIHQPDLQRYLAGVKLVHRMAGRFVLLCGYQKEPEQHYVRDDVQTTFFWEPLTESFRDFEPTTVGRIHNQHLMTGRRDTTE